MTQFTVLWSICLLLGAPNLWAQSGHCAEEDTQDDTKVPPFPQLFLGHEMKSLRPIGKMVVETSSMGGPLITQEEYIDLEQGKFAMVQSNSEETIYLSAAEQIVLKYRPYTCDSFATDADIFAQDMDNFHAVRFFKHFEAGVDLSTNPLKIYGAMGLWLETINTPKSYTRIVHSYGLEDFEKVEHNYRANLATIPDAYVEFIFNEAMILESITVARQKDSVVLKRYNVLSIEVGDEIKEDVLDIPAGYDCSAHLVPLSKVVPTGADGAEKSADGMFEPTSSNFHSGYLWQDAHVKLEVTATKFGTEQQQQQQPAAVHIYGARTSLVDTVYLELAHASVLVENGPIMHKEQLNGLVMSKIKSRRQETRTIWNHKYNVKYHIDSRSGQCTMSHLDYSKPNDEQAIIVEDEAREDLALEFENGLKFPMHKNQIESLFGSDVTSGDYRLLKTISRPSLDSTQTIEYIILERPQQALPATTTGGQQKWVRILATLVIVTDIPSGQVVRRDVESFTIWVMPPEQTWIEESYHFSVVKKDILSDIYPDVAELFDVSEECYLNDPKKKSGLDYAWAELFYPLSSRRLNVLIENEFQLKQAIYRSLISSRLVSFSSMPRMEVMFSDEGLYLRFLLLDLPPFEMIFDSKQGVKLADENPNNMLSFKLPDERHCARMCQLHDCLAMSFCASSRSCVMSRSPAKLNGGKNKTADERGDERQGIKWEEVREAAGCRTYSHPKPSFIRQLREHRLAKVIAVLQDKDYGNLELPEMPDELSLPREETDISDREYNKLMQDYVSALTTMKLEQGDRVPSMLMSLVIEGHFIVVLPTKFFVEDNPWDRVNLGGPATGPVKELGLDVELQDPEQIVQFFHTGLPGFCLDLEAHHQFALSSRSNQPTNVLGEHYEVALTTFAGLTYDQCALACLDSSCSLFSHCASSLNCVLSNIDTVEEAKRLKYLRSDSECMISQRDFAQHFQKYTQVERPRKWSKELDVVTPNDCAASCVLEQDFNCYSFELCSSADSQGQTCYLQDHREKDRLPAEVKESSSGKRNKQKQSAGQQMNDVACDLYERNYLAEFTEINLSGFKRKFLDHNDPLKYSGLTSFECADRCLNQEPDCSAFEFCFRPVSESEAVNNYEQTCTLIRAKDSNKWGEDVSFAVDHQGSGVNSNLSFDEWPIEYSSRCHVYALKPNTVQAHVRNLAMGKTMTRQELDREKAKLAALGLAFSWSSLFLFVLTLVCVSGALGFGLCWARERSGSVRHRLDQLEAAVRRPFERFAPATTSASVSTLPPLNQNHH